MYVATLLYIKRRPSQPMCCSDSNKDLLTAVLSSEVPATPLGSFPAIFNQALALGTVSRRRVYHEVLNMPNEIFVKFQSSVPKYPGCSPAQTCS